MLSADLSDSAMAVWQRYCFRSRRPFVVVRPESKRVTVWLALPPEREWGAYERERAQKTLIDASGVVLHSAGIRMFLSLGSEEIVLPRLIALALAAPPAPPANWREDQYAPDSLTETSVP
ncbi:MAG TPA: hypothetical protein VJ718_08555 [Candidatus Binataceae bacterium]|nr:hypothetical protein [Candidatus Binataceae bacterium]